VGAELPQHHLVDVGELSDRVGQQIQRTDDATLAPQRHDELRARSRHRFDVTGIGPDVVDQNRLALGDGGAHQAVPDLQTQVAGRVFGIAHRVGDAQLVALRVEQVHREGLELGEPRDQLRNLLQQLVEVEHRGDLPPEREQRRQLLGGRRV
jgi:hypothetical protein